VTPFQVALTFDAEHPDRPAKAGNAERLLDVLAQAEVRATFFVQGRWAEAYPGTARRIGRDGHLVGSHSHYHARMPLLSTAGLATDIRDAEAAIVEHAGVNPRPWFRCPFGAGGEDRRVLANLEALGYREVGWNVNPEDWNPARAAAEVEAAVVAGATAQGDGTVVLQHSWPNQNLVAVPRIVAALRERGATFVGVDELAVLPTRHPG
jgi:peptidoglycan/xylan/chitin deacetylase (PgdA/CDA1 family)